MECQFCRGGIELEKVCGKLHSVINDKCDCVAHHRCMQYSSNLVQFKFSSFGGFYIEHVEKEIKRGQKLKCSFCKRKGATAGCGFKDCKRSYHYPCAKKARDVRVCRLLKYASQDVDPKSTVVQYCVFCCALHYDIYTENLNLVSHDEFSSNSEDDVRSRCSDDLFQQRFPSSPSPDNNMNNNVTNHNKQTNQADHSNCVIGGFPLPLTVNTDRNSVGTCTTSEKNAGGSVSILAAAVSGTPSLAAHHVDQNDIDATPRSDCKRDRLCLKSSQRKRKLSQMECENAEASQFRLLLEGKEPRDQCLNWNESNIDQNDMDATPRSDCRRDRLCLKSSQKKRKARQMGCENAEASQFRPLLNDKEQKEFCLNRNESNKNARIEASVEKTTEATGISESLDDPVSGIGNEVVGERLSGNDFHSYLNDIPDPLAEQVNLKHPRNLPDICVSSSQMKHQRKSIPGHSQPLITCFLTPQKKSAMTVTENQTTEVSKITKEKPKCQRRLKISGTDSKSGENKADKCRGDFNPCPLNILPIDERNISPVDELSFLPAAEIVSLAKEAVVSPGEGASVPFKNISGASVIPELDLSPRTLKEHLPKTSRKLVLDGRGNFSLVAQNKLLCESLSDMSNDDSSESNGIDFNDLDRDATSTPLSLSYEELSSTFFLHQPHDNADIDQVYSLCIPLIKESVDDRTSKALLKYAICSLNLVEENVFVWQIMGLSEIQILGIVLQFSRYLRDQNELELVKMLFGDKTIDINSVLDSEASVVKEKVERIEQEIEQNFSEAEKKYCRSVGKMCSIQDLGISAAFIILSSANDNSNAARSSLPKYHTVHVCSKDTNFVISHNLCETQRTIISDNEYENLKWWLEMFGYSTVLIYPSENILRSSNCLSVANRLKYYFTKRMAPGGDTIFIFIQCCNADLLIYRPFVCKMLAFVKEELLTFNHDACIVFDVGQDLGISRFTDVVLPCLVGDQAVGDGYCFEVKAFSGTNPMYSPVSCLVIHLLLSFS